MSEKRNVPEIRFGSFKNMTTSFWEEKNLGDLGKFLGGGTPDSSNQDFWNGDIPWVSSSDIGEKSIFSISRTRFITEAAIKESATKIVPSKSILIVTRVGVGKVAYTESSICTSQDFTNISPSEGVDPVFLALKIHTLKQKIFSLTQGTSIKGVTAEDLKSLKISLPSIPEQQKIAEFLTTVDKRIELLQAKKEKLEAYKKGVMQQIFSQKLRFKADDGSDFPDWEEKKLGEMAKIFSGGTPKSSKPEFYGGSIPFIRSGEINSTETELFITNKALEKSSAKMVEKGDLLLAIYGATSGEVGISKIDGAINQAILCIRWHGENAFLGDWLKLNKETLTKKYLQGGQGNLSGEIVKSYVIPVPTLEEQKKIVQFLTSLDSSIETLEKQINQTQTWKKGLLQKMFV